MAFCWTTVFCKDLFGVAAQYVYFAVMQWRNKVDIG